MRRREAGAQREACELFEASVAAGPSPHGWLQVGLCREPVDAVASLEAFEAARREAASVEDPMRRNAYLAAATERIEPLARRVPTITFRASSTPGVVAEVTLVGRWAPTPVDRFDEALRFNAGRYQVRAWAQGFSAYTLELELNDGERRVVTLPALQSSLVAAVPAGASPAAPSPAATVPQPHAASTPLPGLPSATTAAPPPGASLREPASALAPGLGGPLAPDGLAPPVVDATRPVINALPVILAGGGLALVLSGVIAGQLSSSERRQLERECDAPDPMTGRRLCGSGLAGTRERMADLALVADVSWVSGALLAASGVGLFILDQRDRDRDGATGVMARCGLSHCALSARGNW